MASADRLIEVFTEAKARPIGAERDQFLSEACRDEPELQQQVIALLLAHEGAGDFLKNKQAIPPVTVLTEKPGDKIGHYKLLQKIGEGGCGVVYMAEQEEPVLRRVALKVIKLGMDTRQVVARFEAEGQALAMMDHPNIAKVFDAGATNTGRPYFVMELVRGIKITDYCDQNNLPTEARLKLFTQVCHAIQHAHQKGIIHRDIKPSNILVTINDGMAVPKVIDFGIAKAIEQRLTDKTVFTAFEQFIGTPAYMSPEQAEMTSLDIDTRADVYSLGVLLYELLSGNTPFDSEKLVAFGVAEIRRIIREQEPPKPSTRLNTLGDADRSTVAQHRHTDVPKLLYLIRGDLDWIVMKCLEKDRTRRYETANGLAMDLQRHLDNQPIIARPPSNLYRFQKLVHRHKLAFAAATAIVAALTVGLTLSSIGFLQARRPAQIARTQAARSEQVAQFLKDMLNGVGPSVALGRDTTMLREILGKTAQRLNDLKGQPKVEAELRETLASVYRDLGEYDNAEKMAREALALKKQVYGNEHSEVAEALDLLATVLQHSRKSDADILAREGLGMRRKLLGNEDLDVAASLYTLGYVLRGEDKLAEAELLFREALAIQRKQLGNENAEVARTLTQLAGVLGEEGKLAEAEGLVREGLAISRKLFGNEHPDTADSLGDLSMILRGESKLAEAELMRRENVAIRKKLLGSEHPLVAVGLYFLGGLLVEEGKLADAESVYREVLAIERKLPHTLFLTSSLYPLADLLRQQNKLDEVETLGREELAIRRKLLGNEHPDVAVILADLAVFLRDEGKLPEAETTWREALAIASNLQANATNADALNSVAWNLVITEISTSSNAVVAVELAQKAVAATNRKDARKLSTLAAAYSLNGEFTNAAGTQQEAIALMQDEEVTKDYASRLKLYESNSPYRDDAALTRRVGALLVREKFIEAEPPAREYLTICEKKFPNNWVMFDARSMLGGSLLGQKKYAEAEPLLLSGYEGMKQREEKIPAIGKLRLKESLQRLVQLYQATGQSEKSAEWNKKLAEFNQP